MAALRRAAGSDHAGRRPADHGCPHRLADAPGSRLNLLLSDGEQIIATAWGHALSWLVRDDCTVVASEPYDDDPAWEPVPEHSLVTARAGEVTVTALEAP